ncbi:MAG: hypothetical protein QXP38_11670 [Nitrososphaerota archaeon]
MKEAKRRALSVAPFFVLMLVFLYSFNGVTASGGTLDDNLASLSSTYYGGKIYTGRYLSVGVNDYGALGVRYDTLDRAGFQYPIGYDYESLAVGWWGEGWSVFYGDNKVGFSPHDDVWGTLSLTNPKVTWTETPYGYLHIIRISTNDLALLLEFRVEIFRDEKYIKIETYITNTSGETITDLEYKRIVDWDVWVSFPGRHPDYRGKDYWGMDDIRRQDLNLAVAFVNESIALGTVYMGFASLEPPTDYDLYWDRYRERGLTNPVKFSIREDGTAPKIDDFCVVYDWLLGTLEPGETKAIHTIYAAGDTLEELENNVERALSQYKPVGGKPVGGIILSEAPTLTASYSNPPAMTLIAFAIIVITISLIASLKRRWPRTRA